ncbi:universal stress protein, partial [Streptomyces sp. ADMS]|nr:universal stress protein [Streptomyces sp. ADMS]
MLGSRGLGMVAGVLLGPVALAVVARAQRPVVLVRADDEHGQKRRTRRFGGSGDTTPYRDVVLGLDLRAPDGRVLGFAFDARVRTGPRAACV